MTREPRIAGLRRFFTLPRSTRTLEREIDDEIRFHIESRVADLVTRGTSRDAAREKALSEYGDVMASRRELNRLERRRLARERWVVRAESIRQDLAYAARSLARQRGFALSVIGVLALGIGANATMFGVIDRLLLRPPALVADPARVVTADFVRSYDGGPIHQETLSYPQYLDLAGTKEIFDGVAAYTQTDLALGHGADARSVRGMKVSASYFSMLGVRARLGRFFLPEDDGAPVAPNVAVISYGFWERQFAADADILGRALQLGDSRYIVVGVAPRHFVGLSSSAIDVWIPITSGATPQAIAGWSGPRGRNGFWLQAAARLRSGVDRDRAAASASRALRANMLRDGVSKSRLMESQPRFEFRSVLPREALAHDADAKVALLLGAVSVLVLVIACANVANLQLARGIRRQREIAVRSALGAGVGRLVQQLLCEGALLATLGGVGALVIVAGGASIMQQIVFPQLDWEDTPAIDLHVLAYAALAAIAAGVLTGLVPAVQARRSRLSNALHGGAREGRVHQSKARLTLLIVQAALSVVMLVGTGLFVRSLRHVQALSLGMEPQHVLTAQLNLSGLNYTQPQIDALYHRLESATLAHRGIESAALSTSLPFWTSWGTTAHVPGRDSLPRVRDGGPYFNGVTPGYLRTMGMRLLRGRDFTVADQNPSRRVMIVNEAFARLAWPNDDALGRCVRLGSDTAPCAEVIGVIGNPRRQGIIEDVSLQLFLPLEQAPPWVETRTLVIRPTGDARRAMASIRRYLQTSAPDLPYVDLRWMEELVTPQTRSWRMGASVFAAFGALALLLAMVGLYSMLSYDVAQRAHELGVRVALGAQRGDLASLVVGAGARIIAVGAAIGLGIVLLAGRFVQPLLFETSPREPEILVGALGVMLAVTVVATLLPTRRALKVDPIIALRAD
ncbi:MAG TPA: ABC transporter permease [Gemmatimonadaceae bacterium]|nr:ABC transporter permease [Gemmatimonadaceae bacterium]